jgi:hypothetical protein
MDERDEQRDEQRELPEDAYRIRLEEVAALYALGALDDEADRAWLDELISRRDPAAMQLVSEMLEATSLLAEATPQIDPAARVEENLFAAIHASERPPIGSHRNSVGTSGRFNSTFDEDHAPVARSDSDRTASRMNRYFIGLGAVVMLLLVVSIGLLMTRVSPDARLKASLTTLLHQRDSLQDVLTERGHDDTVIHALFDMLQERSSRFITLAKATPDAVHQHIFFSPKKRMVIVMRETLEPMDTPKVYAVWEQSGNKYMPVGSFTVDPKKPKDMYDFPVPSDSAQAFMIAAEPAAMGPQPKGPVLFAGLVPEYGRQ